MAQTPNPSAAEVLDVAQFSNKGISAAQIELLRRIEDNLPGVIEEYNTRHNMTGIDAIPPPAGYKIMPTVLDDVYLNNILVGVSVEVTTQGFGGFRKNAVLVVYNVDEAVLTPEQVAVHWKRTELICDILLHFLTGCVNATGVVCWRQLEPIGYNWLENDWGNGYSVTQIEYRLIQA